MEKIVDILSKLNIDYAYSHFNDKPSIPYAVYYEDSTLGFAADNYNYHDISNIMIELYDNKRNLLLEEELEVNLKENKIFYRKEYTWNDVEELFIVYYYISLI